MTSLQEQLKRLSVPHVQHSLEGKKSSLLFDSREVQAIDKEVLFEVASTALKELISVNSTFKKYEDLLFHKSQIYVDRTLQDKSFNEKLNKILKRYLIELSPYFMMKNAQKTLEWLVHHYKIELFNADDLIMTFLPFHQTNIFVRLLMMLDLEKSAYKWHWMHECAKNGISLPKTLLLTQCKRDSAFLQRFFSMVEEYSEVMGNDNPNLSLVVDHCNVIGLLLLERSCEVSEEVVSTLVQYVLRGLKSRSPLREVGCYPIIATLAARVPLREDKVMKVLRMVVKCHSEECFTMALYCLSVLISQQQDHLHISPDVFKHLHLNDLQIYEVEEFSKRCPTSPLLKLLVGADESGALQLLVEKIETEKASDMEVDTEEIMLDGTASPSHCKEFLEHLYKHLEPEDFGKLYPSTTFFLTHTSYNLVDIATIKALVKDISQKMQHLERRDFDAKLVDLQRLHKRFPEHSANMRYFVGLLLSELLKKLLTADADIHFTTATCHALSKQVLRGVYNNCTRKVFQERVKADVHTPVDLKDAASMDAFNYNLLTNLLNLLKWFVKKHPSLEQHKQLLHLLLPEVFLKAKDQGIRKEVANLLFKHFKVNFLIVTYLQLLCRMADDDLVASLPGARLDHFVSSSKGWFLRLLRGENGEISEHVLLCLILLLARNEKVVRDFVTAVLEASFSREPTDGTSFNVLLGKLLVFKEELQSDASVLCRVLSAKLTCDSEMQGATNVVLEALESWTPRLKCKLLDNLRRCKNKELLSKTAQLASACLNEVLSGVNVADNIGLFEHCVQCLSSSKKFARSEDFHKLSMVALEGDLSKLSKQHCTQLLQTVLQNVTVTAYQGLSEEQKRRLISQLLNLALNKTLDVSMSVTTCLRNLPIASEVLEDLFGFSKEQEGAKLKRKKQKIDLDLSRLTFVLQVLHTSENMDRGVRMCSFLCTTLTHLEARQDTDYTCQLLLTCLHNIVTSLSASEAKQYEDCLNLEALVQCLRRTSNFQTQQHIVLVLTAIAPFFPDQLLNNIISIFAFMGDNFVQKDDAYSFQILTRLVSMALSVVLKLPKEDPKRNRATIDIMRVFIDSRRHIPQHRLIPLLTQLLSVGVEEYLWKLLLLVVESISLHREHYKLKMSFEYDTIVSLFCKFSIHTQLSTLISLTSFLITYLDALDANNKASFEVLGPLVSSSHTRFITLHLNKVICNILSDPSFNRAFLQLFHQAGAEVEEVEGGLFQSLVNNLVQYILSINRRQKTIPHEMFWPALLKLVNLNLTRLNHLIPAPVFVQVLHCLLAQSIQTVKSKGLEMMHAKLEVVEQGDLSADDYHSMLSLLPLLLSSLQTTHDERLEENKGIFYIQQLSFLNLKILCKCYGSQNVALFNELPRLILKCLQNKTNNIAVIDSALFCLSEVVVLMKNRVVPHLNTLMPALTDLFERNEMLHKTVSLDCLLGVLNQIISHLGHFISPFLDQLIHQLCCLPAQREVLDKLNEKSLVIAKTVETRLLIPSLMKTYQTISSPSGYRSLLTLFKTHLESAGKEQLVASSRTLCDFLCLLLNLRNNAAAASVEEVEELEDLLVQATLALVVHLSEVTFRPLLERLYNAMHDDVCRTLTFFALMCALSQKLKSIFNLFSAFLLKLVVKLLQAHNQSLQGNHGDGDDDGAVEATEEQSCLLLRRLLTLVTTCYSCDVDGAFALSTGDVLFVPVVEQLENLKGDYESRLDEVLLPCLVQMGQSIRQNDQLTMFNKLLCFKTKHQDWRVRVGAVKALKGLVEALGNLYEVLFPETASYLSELLEDDDDVVATHSRLLRGSLEKVIGTLDNFF